MVSREKARGRGELGGAGAPVSGADALSQASDGT